MWLSAACATRCWSAASWIMWSGHYSRRMERFILSPKWCFSFILKNYWYEVITEICEILLRVFCFIKGESPLFIIALWHQALPHWRVSYILGCKWPGAHSEVINPPPSFRLNCDLRQAERNLHLWCLKQKPLVCCMSGVYCNTRTPK